MPWLTDLLDELEAFRELVEQSRAGRGVLSSPSFLHPFLIAGLLADSAYRGKSVLVVTPSEQGAEDLARELSLYLPKRSILRLPSRDVWYGPQAEVAPRVVGRRARTLAALGRVFGNGVQAGCVPVVVAGTPALLEAARPGAGTPFSLETGSTRDIESLLYALVELGYKREDQVEDPGDFAVRGGLIDIFPSTEATPVRVEFWGDEIESIRSFSVYTQRSLGSRNEVDIWAAQEDAEAEPRGLPSLLPQGTHLIIAEPQRSGVAAAAFTAGLDDVYDTDDPRRALYLTWDGVREALVDHSRTLLQGGGEAPFTLRGTTGDLPVTNLPEAEEAVRRLVADGFRVAVAFELRAEAERAEYILVRAGGRLGEGLEISEKPGLTYMPVALRRHFLLPDLKLALLTDNQIFPKRRKATAERRLVVGAELSSFRDLRRGDHIVHEDHGVGRFEGISTRTVAGITRDYLDLAFRDQDMLYIPHDQIGKVSRYVGATGAAPTLSKLGGKAWDQLKNRARRAVRELAGELLHLYALRQTAVGYVFAEDGDWQRRFESAFPYQETPDQLTAIDVVKDDMESAHPMDRLICGDVGYGKTEVALRAAFKAVMDGRQVMMLVPTTILAQQHYGTFRERFADFPVEVDMLSRFRSSAEQKKVLKEFEAGRLDVVIGTHRLLSQDVKPKNLGLVIVDEEQRFGVAQKETLRRLKLKVDVLTLSATPIPRTLQMSLAGVRDITVIETPPRDRHPIQTYVGMYDSEIVKRAIDHEVKRGGQVFYLHNRVETIKRAAAQLAELMPHIRFGVAHGRMKEQVLEGAMLEFLRGNVDVLVTTTIIESGLDMPNVNTLIVERADLLGLAQLYQIRGRIGRSSRVAHAFLFHPDEAQLTGEAVARLSTLSDYTELGSGFKIALRDLEIRGAGNLLGDEQSGHIAAVGFEMYLSMLRETVEMLQGKEHVVEKVPRIDMGISAYVPSDFIGYEAAKVDLHRRVAGAENLHELGELRDELQDRFGLVPEPVDNLIFLGEVRLGLQQAAVDGLAVRGNKITVSGFHPSKEVQELLRVSREQVRVGDRLYSYVSTSGMLTYTHRGEDWGPRKLVELVVNDILSVLPGGPQDGRYLGQAPSEAT
ncbi:MAG: transcription-repair coupling factor [Actinobacteria bacterium]|nr:transcription-repair coupling factor [Actinomycetota bacterium]